MLAKFKLSGLLTAVEVSSASEFSCLLSKFKGILLIYVYRYFVDMTLTEEDSEHILCFLDTFRGIKT